MCAWKIFADRWLRWVAIAALALATTTGALAHKASDAYLFFSSGSSGSQVRWDIALRDLDQAIALDSDGDHALRWREVRAAWPQIEALADRHLQVQGCVLVFRGEALERRSDGVYAVLRADSDCRIVETTAIGYSLFADIDATHRGIARFQRDGAAASVRLLEPLAVRAGAASIAAAEHAATESPASFIVEGLHHIVTGYDHLLFLLCLLLPAVMNRDKQGSWVARDSWRETLLPVAGTVTLFTLAHSITLAAAALQWVRLPSWFVEPAIAITIALTAFDNLRPVFGRYRAWITFGFGLVHGFGFAGVLAELQLPPAAFGWALLQFNLGIELGQLGVVAALVPMLFWLRARRYYVPALMRGGSAAAMAMAMVWLIERSADVRLLSF